MTNDECQMTKEPRIPNNERPGVADAELPSSSLDIPSSLGIRHSSLPSERGAVIPEATAPGRTYWRSLDELADTPEFRQWVENEFPAGATELEDPVTRRHFMKIMSASFLLAGFGLTGCRRPVSNILPFNKQPEGY